MSKSVPTKSMKSCPACHPSEEFHLRDGPTLVPLPRGSKTREGPGERKRGPGADVVDSGGCSWGC